MRHLRLLSSLAVIQLALLSGIPAVGAQEKDGHGHPPKYKGEVKKKDRYSKEAYNLNEAEHRKRLVDALLSGELESLEIDHGPPDPMEIVWDLGLWSVVVFLLLLFILGKWAWAPMLEGLKKREEHIKASVEEAKKARAETERVTNEFKVKMDQAYAEIPKIMAEARREAEAFKEEMRAQTAKDIQTERQRLRREIDTARDQALQEIWNQAAQLATLISAKAIGRSLTEDDHRRLLDEALNEIGQAARR
jgi:F-type H+-transporting ATPase subunit b